MHLKEASSGENIFDFSTRDLQLKNKSYKEKMNVKQKSQEKQTQWAVQKKKMR